MPQIIQPSFSKGEIAPNLHGRVDTAAYQVALATAKNAIIHPYGGVSNRQGTTFIGPAKEHTYAPRLIPFSFKAQDQYILEFGNQYMRVIRNDGYVTHNSFTVSNITQADPAVVTANGHSYSDGDEVFISGVGGMVQVNSRRFIVANATSNTFELTSQVDGTNIDSSGYDAFTSNGTVSQIYEITTPYSSDDINDLKYVQSADTLTLTHKDYAARDLVRADHDDWTLSVVSFVPSQDHPTGVSVTVNTSGSETIQYTVTAIKQTTFEESLSGLNNTTFSISGATQADPVVITATGHSINDGDEIEINNVSGMTELNGRRFIAQNTTAHTLELANTDGTGYSAYTSGGDLAQTFVEITNSNSTADNTISWTAVDGAFKYTIYKKDVNGVFGLIGESTSTSFLDSNIEADTTVTPPLFRDPISLEDDFPGASSYFQQRQVFGGSVNAPDTAHYSRIGDRTDLSASSPARADDAFSVTMAARMVNEIRHFVPLNDLIILTDNAEWRVSNGTATSFELSTITQRPQSFWGTSHIRPLIVGNLVFFVEESKAQVRSLGYTFSTDSYTGTNLGLLANHLLDNNTVEDWSYEHSPETRVYMCRDDGQALTLTFDNEQEVIAWTHWITDGSFERSAELRHGEDNLRDSIYFVVKRKIGSNTVRYIEKLNLNTSDNIEDMFYVDSGLSRDPRVDITAVSLTDPVVVTAPGHGLSDGDLVDIFDITWEPDVDKYYNETQPSQLQGRYQVQNTTANTFEVINYPDGDNVDGTSWNAYKSGGKAGKPVLTLTNLHHLEGKTLVALADGNVYRDLTVSAGAITLPRKHTVIHIGLNYICDIETLNLEAPSGTMQGVDKKIPKVTVRFDKSRGMLIGPNEDRLVEMKQREYEVLGAPTALLTGDKEVILKPDWNSRGRILIRQPDPLPINVLAIVPTIEISDV